MVWLAGSNQLRILSSFRHTDSHKTAASTSTTSRPSLRKAPGTSDTKITIQLRRFGTHSNYSHRVALAVGASGAGADRAGVLIKVEPARKGVRISRPFLIGGAGEGGRDALIRVDADVTDRHGEIHGFYITSNVGRNVMICLKDNNGKVIDQAVADQRWNDVADGSDWPNDVSSPFFDYDTPIAVTFKPKFRDGHKLVPITGHHISFVVTQAIVDTVDQNGNPTRTIYSGRDAVVWAIVTPATSTDASDGVYNAAVTIPDPGAGTSDGTIIEVESVSVDAVDEGAFKQDD